MSEIIKKVNIKLSVETNERKIKKDFSSINSLVRFALKENLESLFLFIKDEEKEDE